MSLRNKAVTIRPASPGDIGILTEIHAASFANYWNAAAFNDFFAVSGTIALIAEILGEPAGMMVFRLLHEQADIITIAVTEPHRRSGLARALMDEALAQAVSGGATRMFLDVEDGNRAALSLYKNYGFTLISRRKLYYKQKDGSFTDALVMTRKLA